MARPGVLGSAPCRANGWARGCEEPAPCLRHPGRVSPDTAMALCGRKQPPLPPARPITCLTSERFFRSLISSLRLWFSFCIFPGSCDEGRLTGSLSCIEAQKQKAADPEVFWLGGGGAEVLLKISAGVPGFACKSTRFCSQPPSGDGPAVGQSPSLPLVPGSALGC